MKTRCFREFFVKHGIKARVRQSDWPKDSFAELAYLGDTLAVLRVFYCHGATGPNELCVRIDEYSPNIHYLKYRPKRSKG